jgi:uncharacterized protein
MHVEHHPFISQHPEWQEKAHELKLKNAHFARMLREYEGIDKEICRSEDGVQGYLMSDTDLENLKKERLHLADSLISMIKWS